MVMWRYILTQRAPEEEKRKKEKRKPVLIWSQTERSVCQYTGQTLSCYYNLDTIQPCDPSGIVDRVHDIQGGSGLSKNS